MPNTETPTATLPSLLTAREVAAQTGLSVARIYEGGREGWLPCVRLGRAMRFQASALADFFASGGTTDPKTSGARRAEEDQGEA